MRLAERYIFVQATLAFLAALVCLTGVIWVTESLRQIDLLTTKGQTLLIFLALTSLTLPSLIVVIAPIAAFIGVVYTLNRLNGDSELVVLSAAGVSPSRLLRPILALSLVATLMTGALSIWALPGSFVLIDRLIMNVRADFITHVVREGTFATLARGFVFHYRERARDGSLRVVFMQDRRDPQHVTTYLAQSGRTVTSDAQNFLVLDKGLIQRQSTSGGDPATVTFDRYAIDLTQFAPAAKAGEIPPRDRSTIDLLRADTSDPYVARNLGAFRNELHNRLVNPLYSIALPLIGFAALCRARTTRQARGGALAGAAIAVLLLRGAGFWASALDQRHAWAFIPIYGLPLSAGMIALAASLGGVGGRLSGLLGSARSRPAAGGAGAA